MFAQTVTLPFTKANGQNWLLVKLNVNKHPGVFIFDTGANNTVVSTALTFDIQERGRQQQQGITGALTGVDVVSVRFDIAGDDVAGRVLTQSFDKLSKAGGVNVDGILGMDVLGRYEIILIDTNAQTITLTRKGTK